MKATPKNIRKFQGQKVWAIILTPKGKYLNIVDNLGIDNSCSGGLGNGIITNFIPFIKGFKRRYNILTKTY